jgi:hypothetical protein
VAELGNNLLDDENWSLKWFSIREENIIENKKAKIRRTNKYKDKEEKKKN